ncbi:MAG: cold-shock protein DNA-binding protein [Deltaproteobacteria bacterium]|nr:cold-shock protein DNA-binding protein [Deltaproteobacteria bacterium]
MQAPVVVTFRSMDRSPAVEQWIESSVEQLVQSFRAIERCSVVIEIPHRHQRQGQTFHVRIELTVPDRVITVSRDPGLDQAHEDVYVALADAFRAARRQLQDHAHIRRGDVKLHA